MRHFFFTANVGRLFIENVYVLTCLIAFYNCMGLDTSVGLCVCVCVCVPVWPVGEEISTCERVFCIKLRPTHIHRNSYHKLHMY